jgi:hypothetical protein
MVGRETMEALGTASPRPEGQPLFTTMHWSVVLAVSLILLSAPRLWASPNVTAWGDNKYGQTDVPPDLTDGSGT